MPARIKSLANTDFTNNSAKRTYTIHITVAGCGVVCSADTGDRLHLRICNNALCSTWTELPNGLDTEFIGQTHTYLITTPYDYGTMNKLQIAHTGKIPTAFQNCKDLYELDLSYNKITGKLS